MDDSFITYRYAENLVHGNGLVYNAGEGKHSEGLVNPLWAVILSLCPLTGIDIRMISRIIGVISTFLTSVLIFISVFYIVKLFIKNDSGSGSNSIPLFFASLASGIFLIDPFTAANSLSGMETTFAGLCFSLFLFTAVYVFNKSTSVKLQAVWLFILALASCLLRPELIVSITVIFLLCMIINREKRNQFIFSITGFVLFGSIYFFFRHNYYEAFFPLPFYVKPMSFDTGIGFLTILRYLWTWMTALPLLIVFVLWIVRSRKTSPLLVLTIGISCQFVYWLFPEQMMGFGYRYFQPLAPFFAAASVTGLSILYFYIYQKKGKQCIANLSLVLIIPLIVFRFTQLYDAKGWFIGWYSKGMNKMIEIGTTLKSIDPSAKYSIGLNDCGAIPYYSGWKAIDFAGLNNRNIALNLSKESVYNEISFEKPSVVVLGSRDREKFVPLFANEDLFYARYRSLGYRYIGSMEIFPESYYRFYTNDTVLSPKLKNALEKKSSLYETPE